MLDEFIDRKFIQGHSVFIDTDSSVTVSSEKLGVLFSSDMYGSSPSDIKTRDTSQRICQGR